MFENNAAPTHVGFDRTLVIEYFDPYSLTKYPRNPRTHSKKQIHQLAGSIKGFGFTNPILIDEACGVLAGHGRLEAAKLLGLKTVPCVRLANMSAAQKQAYVIADNKLSLNAGWDEDILAIELQHLSSIDLEFDVEITGFSTAEIDQLVSSVNAQSPDDPKDEAVPNFDGPSVSKPGDLWLLGSHRVYCGNSCEEGAFRMLMGTDAADMVFTDPPYNVRIDGNVGGLGKIKHREFAMAAGEMSPSEFTSFLRLAFEHLASHSRDGSIQYICMDWRHIGEVLQAANGIYAELKNLCVWAKDNAGMGTFYRSQHELVFVFKAGHGTHINNFELGQHGRHRTNVWSYRGMSSRTKTRNQELALHPTVKPVAMIADAIRDVCPRAGIVLDCFGGSGSTLIAAHKTGRRARVIELDPIYVDRMIRRWQTYANDDAILAASQRTFDDIGTGDVSWEKKRKKTMDGVATHGRRWSATRNRPNTLDSNLGNREIQKAGARRLRTAAWFWRRS